MGKCDNDEFFENYCSLGIGMVIRRENGQDIM